MFSWNIVIYNIRNEKYYCELATDAQIRSRYYVDIKLFKIIHETRVCLPDDLMCRLNQL